MVPQREGEFETGWAYHNIFDDRDVGNQCRALHYSHSPVRLSLTLHSFTSLRPEELVRPWEHF